MMKRSNKGMAKVSVLWSIIFVVAALVGFVAFFLTNGELENQASQVARLTKDKEELTTSNRKAAEDVVALSRILGFTGDSSRSDVKAAEEGFANLKKGVPEIGESDKDFGKTIPAIITALSAAKAKATDIEGQLGQVRVDLEAAQKVSRETSEAKDRELAKLSTQITDTETRSSEAQQQFERSLAEARAQAQASDTKARQIEALLTDSQRKFVQELEGVRTRLGEMGRKLNPIIKEPQRADGKILSVSKELGMGWINLGAKNRLPIGTRFHVISAATGDTRIKAMAEVRDVKGDMAEVSFYDQHDPFDSPAPGDTIYNPVYDPTGERHAMLIGSFSGAWSEAQLEGMLQGMGIKVVKKFDNSVDFLIVGAESWVDENKQPVETPIQPSESPVFKEAVAAGAQIVLLNDLRAYFRF